MVGKREERGEHRKVARNTEYVNGDKQVLNMLSICTKSQMHLSSFKGAYKHIMNKCSKFFFFRLTKQKI